VGNHGPGVQNARLMKLQPLLLSTVCLPATILGQEPRKTARFESNYEAVDAFPAQKPFDRPLALVKDPVDSSACYVVQQYGRVLEIPRDGTMGDREVFLDWREKTLSPKSGGHNEEGLLGFAFDPDYARNGFFYIYYSFKTGERESRRRPGRKFALRESRVSRLHVDRTPKGDPRGFRELVLMKIPQPYGNHNGGTILFGADKMLYIALGDGGLANDPKLNGQNLQTLLGAILRVDVRGATKDNPYIIPKDNPFVGRQDARGEIWAYGFRNPWRINFDSASGDLWCADVGQNIWEEVDRVIKGGNYGWNKMEATHPFPPRTRRDASKYLPPVAEYHHREGISITGGQVYRGEAMPELVGQYLYADYVSGRLWSVKEDRKGGKHEVRLLIRKVGAVASFAEGAAGEVFLLTYEPHRILKLQRRTKKAAK
jgi:glucose/arabinose dehydrogenase